MLELHKKFITGVNIMASNDLNLESSSSQFLGCLILAVDKLSSKATESLTELDQASTSHKFKKV